MVQNKLSNGYAYYQENLHESQSFDNIFIVSKKRNHHCDFFLQNCGVWDLNPHVSETHDP